MDPFLKMDIFFFVTTLVVLVLGGMSILIMLKLWKIMGHIERIAELAEHESGLIKEDIDQLRADVRKRGFKLLSFMRFLGRLADNFTRVTKK